MVDYVNRTITLPAEIVKNRRKSRTVLINNELWPPLVSVFEKEYPDDFYIFGSHRPAGEGNIGLHVDFMPEPTKLKEILRQSAGRKSLRLGLK